MITSLANEKIKHARALLQQRKARERHQQFVLEGARAIHEVERAGIEPALLFLSPPFAQSEAGQRLAQRWPRAVEIVSEKVMHALSDTVSPQGVVAVVPFTQRAPARRDLLLLVDQLREPGNLGTLLRAAAAAGVDEVLLTRGSVDIYSPKVVRAAMGAHFRLPIQPELDAAQLGEHLHSLHVLLADAGGELDYDQWDWRQPSVLIVGSEAEGASADVQAIAQQRVRIPMQRETESLNVAMAGSIILFEAARQRRQS